MTISLSATVALACLFSPKVYIILVHPEKNMRITKQLKAQAHSLKFASQIATKTEMISSHQITTADASSSEDNSQVILSNSSVAFKSTSNHRHKTIVSSEIEPKVSTVV